MAAVTSGEDVRAESMLARPAAYFVMSSQRTSLMQMGLGSLCSVMTQNATDLPCNPALLPESEDSTFATSLMLGDDYDLVSKNRDLFDGKDKVKLAENILSEKDPIRLEGASYIWWRSPYFSVSLEPIRLTYFSRVRNQAFPEIAVQAMQEQSLQVQIAGFLNKNLSLGFSLRGVERKIVQEEFNLFDALTHVDDYFEVKTQRALWLQPGISYLFDDEETREWHPRVSFLVSQLGYVDHNYDNIITEPYIDAGISVTPPALWGEWEWALNYRWLRTPDFQRKFRLGTQYHLGFLNLLAAYDRDEWDAGIMAQVKFLSISVLWKQQKYSDFDGNTNAENATYLEIRFVF
jgi:hypothetical protein